MNFNRKHRWVLPPAWNSIINQIQTAEQYRQRRINIQKLTVDLVICITYIIPIIYLFIAFMWL